MFASALQTSDQGYLMTGTEIGFGSFSIDLVKTDTAGTVEWAKAYHSGSLFFPYSDAYTVNKIIQTSGGGYMLCGSRESDFFLLKIDVNGNISWAKSYNKADEDVLYSVKQTNDGGYIAVGSTRLSSNDSLSAYILKVNSSGTLQWGADWDNTAINSDDVFYDAIDAGDGYIATGYVSEVSGSDTTTDLLVIKTDLNGNLSWQKSFGDISESEEGRYIIQDGSNFYIAGNTEHGAFGTDALFMQLSSSGVQNFTKSFNYGLTDLGMKVTKTSTGYLLFGGDPISGNIFMFTLNTTGNFQWGWDYTGGGSFPVYVDGQQTADGGYMLGTMATNYNYYLVKTNPSGSSKCYENSLNITTNTISLTAANYSGTYVTGGSESSPSVSADNFSIDTTYVDCIEVPCDTPTVTVNPTAATICDNENQTITATSPTATSYSWSNGQSGSNITVSPNNTTTYTVTAYKGICPSHPVDVTINVNASPNLTISGNTNICEGKYTTLTASGANTYNWSTGASSASITVFPTADSTFTVIGYNANCSDTLSQLVTVGQNPNISISGNTTICYGQSTTLTASSNNGGNSFEWDNGDNSASTTVNPTTNPTTYWVTVTNTSTTCYDSANVSVTVNPLPTINFSGDTSLCIGESTTITATGGDDYTWNTGSTYDTINVAPNTNTQYIVSVTNSTTTCNNSDTITVYVHPLPTATAYGDTTICENLPAPLNATGGDSYQWSPASSLSDANIANPTATPSATTTYYVTVTSIYNCSDIDSVIVNINQAPQFTMTADSTLCYGDTNGSASLNISQSQNYSYLWNTSDTTTSISGLIAGSYTVTVTDTIGCYSIDSIIVNQPYQLSDSAIVHNISCFKDTNGQIMLSVYGGTTPYNFVWSNSQTTQNISNLSAGYYNVTITDKNNCNLTHSNIIITEPSEIILSTYSGDINCYGDTNSTININASGGVEGFSYYSNGIQVSNPVNNLGAGTYIIEARDSNNCSVFDTVQISQPTEITATDSIYYQNFGGNIVVNATGGISPYSYLWSTGNKQNTVNNLSTGTYDITITDGNGCEYTSEYTIDIPLQIPSAITPNGDGYNDTWNIINIESYKEIKIQIFNRWGSEVFTFEGSGYDYKTTSNQWDGTYKGKPLPVAGYLYIVNLGNGIIKSGPITLIR